MDIAIFVATPVVVKPVVVAFGILGDYGTIQGHTGAQDRKLCGAGVGIFGFALDFVLRCSYVFLDKTVFLLMSFPGCLNIYTIVS